MRKIDDPGRVQVVRDFAISCWRSRRHEVQWTAFGTLVGIGFGALVGGVGIALVGSAWGVPGMVLFAVLGAVIGDRIGVECDKNALGKGRPL